MGCGWFSLVLGLHLLDVFGCGALLATDELEGGDAVEHEVDVEAYQVRVQTEYDHNCTKVHPEYCSNLLLVVHSLAFQRHPQHGKLQH